MFNLDIVQLSPNQFQFTKKYEITKHTWTVIN